MPYLALFDVDLTILEGDSDSNWGDFLAERGCFDRADYARMRDHFGKQYYGGTLDMVEYTAYKMSIISHLDLGALRALRADFFQARILPMLRPKAVKTITAHKERGARVLLISATPSFLLEPLAQHLAVELIGTDIKIKGEHFAPEVDGVPCFQGGKITKLNFWLQQNRKFQLPGAWFYSDSRNDLPLLKIVDNPVVVNPDSELKRVAEANNWPEAEFALGD